jgi:hypothetical protein
MYGLVFAAVTLDAAPAVAAECPGVTQAAATFDHAIPSDAYLESLHGADAQAHVATIDTAIAQARTCLSKGSVDEKSSALAYVSSLTYREAYLLTHDGIATDRAAAVTLAKQNERELNAFESSHLMSSQGSADFDNWLYWDDLMINKPDKACLGC